MAAPLYRNRALKVTLALLLVLTTAYAQRKPQRRGPRATALVVMSPDGKSALRLIPICIFDNDRFWDASIYQASPRPMALEPGTVYEVERTGNPIGLFTVAQPVQELGSWIGLGSWQPPRPRAAASASATTAAPSSSDDDRPVLRRGTPPATPKEAPAEASAPPPPPSSDPDRPLLKRGKPAPGSEPAIPAVPAPSPSAPKSPEPAAKSHPPELVPAVSDADGPEPSPFFLEPNADQEVQLRKTVSGLAEEAVLKQAGVAAGTARLDFKESSFKYFDLDGNNSAELVLTARAALVPVVPARAGRPQSRRTTPPAPSVALREFYITFIAREDLNGEVRSSFNRIIDARNVDLDGRLELIDAVDVDGDSRGELLFRRLIGADVSYVVLKIGLGQTTKLFDSAGE